MSRDCPVKRQGFVGAPPGHNWSNRASRDWQDKANVYIRMKLMGKEVHCLVDSGCDLTVIPKSLADRCKNLDVQPTTHSIWAANSTPIRIFGEAEIPFVLDNRCIWTPVLISEDVEEVMLGVDWLEDHQCIWDFRNKQLTVDGIETAMLTRRGHYKCQRVLAQEYQEIPPRCQKDVVARVTLLSAKEAINDTIVDSLSLIHI